MPFESHCSKIAEHPGRRCGEPGDGAGVYEPGARALHVRHALGAGLVRVTAADEVPVAGAGHAVAVLGIVDHEHPLAPELEPRIRAMVGELPGAFARPAR